MKNFLILITFLFSTSFYTQLKNIINAPALLSNEQEYYVYGLNNEGGIEISVLDLNLESIHNTTIECPKEVDEFIRLKVTDAGSLLLIEAYHKVAATADYYMYHYIKETKEVKAYGTQGIYFVNENAKARQVENSDLLLLDHLKIYSHYIDGDDIYLLQHYNKKGMIFYSNFTGTATSKNYFNHKANNRLLKCHAVIGEDDGFVWLEKDWEVDLGFESERAILSKHGDNFHIWTNTKKNEIRQHSFNLETKSLQEIKFSEFQIPNFTSKSETYAYAMKTESNILVTIDLYGNGKNLSFGSLDSEAKLNNPFSNENILEMGLKLGLSKNYFNINHSDFNSQAYFSIAYYKVKKGTGNNGIQYSYTDYIETLNGYYTDNKVILNHISKEKRKITKNEKEYEIVKNEFIVKNDKIYNLYVHNEFGKISFGGKKACSFVFYNVENNEFITGKTLSETVFYDDLIYRNDTKPNSSFIVSKDGTKMLWLATLAEDQKASTGTPRNFKVFVDEI